MEAVIKGFFRLSFSVIFTTLLFINSSHAQIGDLIADYPGYKAGRFVHDPARNRVYASITDQNTVLIIDTATNSITNQIAVSPGPHGMAMSADNTILYVASSINPVIEQIDLSTLTLMSNLISAPEPVFSIAVKDNYLYATPVSASGLGIMLFDLALNLLMTQDSYGLQIGANSLLEIDVASSKMYFANTGISPGTLAVFDISNQFPQPIQQNPPGSLGSDGQDLALTGDGVFVSYVAAGGNTQGQYEVQKLDTNSLFSVGSFAVGADPSKMDYSPDGLTAFIVSGPGSIEYFDAANFIVQGSIVTPPFEANEISVDAESEKLYASFDSGIQVFSAVNLITPISAVYFPDYALQTCFMEQVTQNNWQFAEEVTSLECSGRGILDISGIEMLPRLQSLDVNSNNIQFISLLPVTPSSLQSLDISNNNINNITFLQDFPGLKKLNIGDNPIDMYSLYPLSELRGLTSLGVAGLAIDNLGLLPLYDPNTGSPFDIVKLDLSRTPLLNLFGIEQFTGLSELDISNTQIQSLTSLNWLTNLRKIAFENLNAVNLSSLQTVIGSNPELTHINFSGIQIDDLNLLSFINNSTGQPLNLIELQLARTGIHDISQLSSLVNLQVVNLAANDIEILSPLMTHTNITHLNLSGNYKINSFETYEVIGNNIGITNLYLEDLHIGDINLLPLFNNQTGQPYALVELDLSNTGISDIGMLAGYPSLQKLDLSDNLIVDPYPLDGMTNLVEFDISDNLLGDVFQVQNVIANNNSLKKLGLGGMPISDLNSLPIYFSQTGGAYPLTSLRLHNTGIRDIFALSVFSDLEVLDISGNNVEILTPLYDKEKLSKLDVSGNVRLQQVELINILLNKPRLSELGLADIFISNLSALPLYDFGGNPYPITSLNLSNTGISDISAISGLIGLLNLNVSNNKLLDLFPLTAFPDLTELNASNNQLTNLSPLNTLYNLKALDVSNNSQLTDLSGLFSAIAQNPYLRSLNVSGLNITDINLLPIFTSPTGQPYQLSKLDVSNTGITDIASLATLISLRDLNISNNRLIDVVPVGLLPLLSEVDISYTGASSIGQMNSQGRLRSLNLSGNPNISISEVNSLLVNNPLLTTIGLSGIQIGNISALTFGSPSPVSPAVIRNLDISNTGISSVFELQQFISIMQLDISQNSILDLNGLDSLTNLRALDVSNNNIYSLSQIFNLNFLEKLDISSNTQDPQNPPLYNDIGLISFNNPNIRSLGLANLGVTDFSSIGGSSSLIELKLDQNPLENVNGITQLTNLHVLSLQSLLPNISGLPIDVLQLNTFANPKTIDLTGNTNLLCFGVDGLESQYGDGVVIRPEQCLLSLPPSISIIDPIDGSIFDEGMEVLFSASATDPEEGDISARVEWTSSIDGSLGAGTNLPIALSFGEHVVTATITDIDGSVATDSINLTVNSVAPLNYCSSSGQNTWFEWIESIDFNGQLMVSGNNNGYNDNTGTVLNIQRSGSYPIIMNPGFRYRPYTEHWAVWLDTNRDGEFTPDEQVSSGSSFTSLTSTITVPTTAQLGHTRMRVAMRWGTSPSACGTYSWGETEDFTVNIQ